MGETLRNPGEYADYMQYGLGTSEDPYEPTVGDSVWKIHDAYVAISKREQKIIYYKVNGVVYEANGETSKWNVYKKNG